MTAAPGTDGPKGRSLATWLATLIVACVLPLLAVAAWLAYQGVEQQRVQADRAAAERAQSVADAFDQDLRAHIGALRMLAQSPLVDDPSRWPELQREARGFLAAFGSHVILAGGEPMHMLLNTRVPFGTALPPLPSPQGRAAVPLAVQTGQAAVGDLFQGPIAGEPLVAIAVPVPRPGAAPSVLLSTPDARLFQRRLEQLALPAEWAVSLLDGLGEPIAVRAPPAFQADGAADAPGRRRVSLQAAPWTVVLEVPASVYRQPARQAALALGLAIAAALLLAVGGGLLAARRLRRAVESLTQAASDPAAHAVTEINQVRRRLDAANRHRDEAAALERRAAEQARATFELANVGIAQVDPQGHFLRANRKLCEIVGYDEDELLRLRFQDITHPEDLATDLERVRQLLAGEMTSYELDKRYRRKDGREVWVTLAAALVRDAQAEPAYFICVLEDISERKRLELRNREQIEALARSDAEGRELLEQAQRSRSALLVALEDQRRATEALRESEAYRRRLIEQMADGVLLLDVEGRIHDANPRAAAMFACAPGDLQQLRLEMLVAAADQDRLREGVPRMMNGPARLIELMLVRRDGKSFPAEVSAGSIDTRSYVAVLRDVTQRKAAEQALLCYQAELSDLTQRLMAQERVTTRRVAQALHDRLGQTLAVARLRLGALALSHPTSTAAERDAALGKLGDLLAQAVAEARLVLTDLRPPLLEDQGLAPALDNELQRLRPGTGSGSAVTPALEVARQAQAQRWPADVEYAAFMVGREALANALDHAQAVNIRVRLGGDAATLLLTVTDDGIGLAPELARGRPGHLGIVGMRERALAVGARFEVAGQAGGGTRVGFTWTRGPA